MMSSNHSSPRGDFKNSSNCTESKSGFITQTVPTLVANFWQIIISWDFYKFQCHSHKHD